MASNKKFIRLRAENPVCKHGDECVNAALRRDVARQAKGGPRRREAAAGFQGTTAVKPWGSIRELNNKPLAITPRPFRPIAKRLGWTEEKVLSVLKDCKKKGLLRRFGAVLEHRNIGFKTNALVAWKVPVKRINSLAMIVKDFPQVSHCYLRSSYAAWPFNLYTMVHCRDKDSCLALVKSISRMTGVKDYSVLFTLKEFKKTKSIIF